MTSASVAVKRLQSESLQQKSLNELKQDAAELGLGKEDVKQFGSLTYKQTWLTAIGVAIANEFDGVETEEDSPIEPVNDPNPETAPGEVEKLPFETDTAPVQPISTPEEDIAVQRNEEIYQQLSRQYVVSNGVIWGQGKGTADYRFTAIGATGQNDHWRIFDNHGDGVDECFYHEDTEPVYRSPEEAISRLIELNSGITVQRNNSSKPETAPGDDSVRNQVAIAKPEIMSVQSESIATTANQTRPNRPGSGWWHKTKKTFTTEGAETTADSVQKHLPPSNPIPPIEPEAIEGWDEKLMCCVLNEEPSLTPMRDELYDKMMGYVGHGLTEKDLEEMQADPPDEYIAAIYLGFLEESERMLSEALAA